MNPIDHALRLLDTQAASMGVLLAVAAVLVAVSFAIVGARRGSLRWRGAVLVVAVGLLVGGATVEASYYSWYRHRCVLHGSDIDECFGKDGKRLHHDESS